METSPLTMASVWSYFCISAHFCYYPAIFIHHCPQPTHSLLFQRGFLEVNLCHVLQHCTISVWTIENRPTTLGLTVMCALLAFILKSLCYVKQSVRNTVSSPLISFARMFSEWFALQPGGCCVFSCSASFNGQSFSKLSRHVPTQ